MNRYSAGMYENKDEAIRILKDELWMTRYALLSRAPPEIYMLLSSYRSCESRQATYRWLDGVAEKIVESAEPLSESASGWASSRALCPACGEGANSYYERGFALPEGLRRHLVGYGRSQHCIFTEIALKVAHEDWERRFSEEEEKNRQEQYRKQEERRKVEKLYRIEPLDAPKLLDEGMFYSEKSRTEEQMESVAGRLSELGLSRIVEGNVEAWVNDRGNYIVYADHRQLGRINFTIWKKPLPKRSIKASYKYRIGAFHILDSWKKNIREKYEARLASERRVE